MDDSQTQGSVCYSRGHRADSDRLHVSFDIELASASDAAQIAELSRITIEQGLPWRWTQERVRICIRDRTINVAVAREGERVIGFAIMKYGDDEASLLLFGV